MQLESQENIWMALMSWKWKEFCWVAFEWIWMSAGASVRSVFKLRRTRESITNPKWHLKSEDVKVDTQTFKKHKQFCEKKKLFQKENKKFKQ